MKNFLPFVFTVFAVSVFAQVDVTFQVDMTGQTVSAEGVHIAGSLNGWATDANMLADQGNNIYAITLSLQPGVDYEYKYLNGNAWGTEEAAPATCTVGGSNRIFTALASAISLPVTPFNSCPASEPTQMVKFSVDMSGQTVSAEGVHVAGNFNAWTPDATKLSPVGNDIYEVTVPVLSSIGIVQYKFVNGNAWGAEETPGDGCANGDNNRPFIINGAGSTVDLPMATFGACPNPLATKTLIFNVNLAGAMASADGVHVVGSFQGWNLPGTPMTDIGDDTYEVAVDVLNSTMYVEYKYLNGTTWETEESIPEACSFNNNRYKIIELSTTGTVALERFEFGTCSDLSVSTSTLSEVPLFQVSPTIATENIQVTWEASINGQAELMIYSLDGKLAFQQRTANLQSSNTALINVNEWPEGMYIVQLRTANKQYSQKIIVK